MTDDAQREAFADWIEQTFGPALLPLCWNGGWPGTVGGVSQHEVSARWEGWLASAARFDAVVGAARDVDESCNWHGPNEVGGDHCFGGFTANTNKPIRSLHTALRALAPAEQPQARSAR